MSNSLPILLTALVAFSALGCISFFDKSSSSSYGTFVNVTGNITSNLVMIFVCEAVHVLPNVKLSTSKIKLTSTGPPSETPLPIFAFFNENSVSTFNPANPGNTIQMFDVVCTDITTGLGAFISILFNSNGSINVTGYVAPGLVLTCPPIDRSLV